MFNLLEVDGKYNPTTYDYILQFAGIEPGGAPMNDRHEAEG
jgi:hypothetical protein